MRYNQHTGLLEATENEVQRLVESAVQKILEMPSFRTARRARDAAVGDLGKVQNMVGDDEREKMLAKRIRQANTFQNYTDDRIQGLVGSAAQVIIHVTDDSAEFYKGKIVGVKKEGTNDYAFAFTGTNIYNPEDTTECNIHVSLLDSDHIANLDGKTDDGLEARLAISNKKKRKQAASLLNKTGNDSALKPI